MALLLVVKEIIKALSRNFFVPSSGQQLRKEGEEKKSAPSFLTGVA